jgi:hypothetical protein
MEQIRKKIHRWIVLLYKTKQIKLVSQFKMDVNGLLANNSYGLNVNGKRTSDVLDTDLIETKRIRIGTEPDTYFLPDVEGKVGDVLVADGMGFASWTNGIYDQPLNTTNDVEFKSVAVEGWNMSQDGAGDFVLEDANNKLLFGGHSQNIRSTICSFLSQNTGGGGGFRSYRSRGTLANPTNVVDGDVLDVRRCFSHDGAQYFNCASIRTNAEGDHSAVNSGTSVAMELTPNGSKGESDYYRFKTNEFQIGLTGNGYAIPTLRAPAANQVLRSQDAVGTVAWDNLPDQSLDVADDVTFNKVTTPLVTIPFTGGGGGVMNLKEASGVSGVEFQEDGAPLPSLVIGETQILANVNQTLQGTTQINDLRVGTFFPPPGESGYVFPSSANSGDIGSSLILDAGYNLQWSAEVVPTSLPFYHQIGGFTIDNTDVETSLTANGARPAYGSMNWPANTLKEGSSWRIHITGTLASEGKNPEMSLRYGAASGLGPDLLQTDLIRLEGIAIDRPFDLQIYSTVVFWTSGTLRADIDSTCVLTYQAADSKDGQRQWVSRGRVLALLSTIEHDWDVFFKWADASAGNRFSMATFKMDQWVNVTV